MGEERICAIIRRFYDRMAADLLVGFFFVGHDLDRIAEKQAAFLLRAMGLRSSYAGLPPASAHRNLPPILAGHFDRRLILLDELLKEEGLSVFQREAWLDFERAFRDSILK